MWVDRTAHTAGRAEGLHSQGCLCFPGSAVSSVARSSHYQRDLDPTWRHELWDPIRSTTYSFPSIGSTAPLIVRPDLVIGGVKSTGGTVIASLMENNPNRRSRASWNQPPPPKPGHPPLWDWWYPLCLGDLCNPSSNLSSGSVGSMGPMHTTPKVCVI